MDALLCKDCRYYRRDWLASQYSKCAHPDVMVSNARSLVAGEALAFCQSARDRNGPCGLDGRLFESSKEC